MSDQERVGYGPGEGFHDHDFGDGAAESSVFKDHVAPIGNDGTNVDDPAGSDDSATTTNDDVDSDESDES